LITRLVARNFRNLEDLSWSPGRGVHLLLGGTGAGKTSVLEAIYVVATTKSFRTTRLDNCLRHGPTETGASQADITSFFLSAEVTGSVRSTLELGWGRPLEGGATASWRTLNGKTAELDEYLGVLPLLSWTAADGELLVGEPELRRRLVDRGIVSKAPNRIALLARHRKVLQQKKRLLLQNQSGLAAWNELLAPAIAELSRERATYIDELNVALAQAAARTDLAVPELRLDYQPSPSEALDGAAAVAAVLESQAGKERERRRALYGSHRDRIQVLWGGREIRTVASAGERKSSGLLLLVAQADVLEKHGRSPALLLDDADIELDQRSLEALWPALLGAPQSFVTSNRPDVWKSLEIDTRWRVSRGRVEAV
jgi:DNA replication and repair protein RecF